MSLVSKHLAAKAAAALYVKNAARSPLPQLSNVPNVPKCPKMSRRITARRVFTSRPTSPSTTDF